MLLFLSIAAGLTSCYWIYLALRPLAEKGVFSAEDWAQLEDEASELLVQRDRLIEELRDIEFEAAMTKVDPRDLEALKERYEDEALRLMSRMEAGVDEYRDRIESAIASRGPRKRSSGPSPLQAEDVGVSQKGDLEDQGESYA